jgi:hypothetical protein
MGLLPYPGGAAAAMPLTVYTMLHDREESQDKREIRPSAFLKESRVFQVVGSGLYKMPSQP